VFLRPIFPKLASMEQTYNNLRYGGANLASANLKDANLASPLAGGTTLAAAELRTPPVLG
jgi:uncharacterized protein YjbI with pentapeptide repeats